MGLGLRCGFGSPGGRAAAGGVRRARPVSPAAEGCGRLWKPVDATAAPAAAGTAGAGAAAARPPESGEGKMLIPDSGEGRRGERRVLIRDGEARDGPMAA